MYPVSINFDFFEQSLHSCRQKEFILHRPVKNAPDDGDEPRAALSWQAQKSASTRTQITEAAIKCFVEYGYSRTTTTLIAQKAGLSRGAMLHHFPSRLAVVRAAVEHLHSKRLRAFRKAVGKPSPDGDHVRQSVEAYWAHVRHPLFVAFFELAVAARSDSELASILRPAQEAFEREWHQAAVDVFPEWRGRGDKFEFGRVCSHLADSCRAACATASKICK